ncbi:DUF748 domain-containing protein [Phenylobacterium sp.]|uniref:DUF748 domain-containing protein n=1 Tax=Phenylobacterium sp. TaxID=1871053 RepID=UPI0028993C8E|nr:DUF748 domain-containing protein [Phenylobacterium sp.]
MTSSADHPDAKSPPPKRRGGPLRLAAWTLGGAAALVGAYGALGFWVAPKVIRSQVVKVIAEKYDRAATLGEVRFNPFTFKLEASDFSLPDADRKPMIGFGKLAVDFSIASIWRGGLAFNEIRLDAPSARLVRRADGRLNIQDLIPPKDKDEPPRKIMIDHLEVRGGRAEVVDLARKAPFAKTFAPIGFTLKDFSTVKDGAAYVLDALSERGEGLAWRGTLGLSPLASRGSFALSRVQVQPLSELAGDAVPFEVTGGELGLSGSYRLALKGETLDLGVEVGEARLTGVGLRAAGADADWITLPAVTAAKIAVDVPRQSVSVGSIEASEPTVRAWTEQNGGVNLMRYAPARPAAGAQAGAPAPAWKVALPELRVRGGRIDFEERSTGKPVRVVASPLDVTVKGLALPIAAPVQVEAASGVDGGGRLAAAGTVTLDKVSAVLDVDAAHLDLVRLQPYIDGAAALKLRSGKASAKGRVTYAADGAAKFEGMAQVDDLHTVDSALEQDFVNWRSLRLDGLSARTQPLAVKIGEVTAREPYAKIVIGPNYVMNTTAVLDPKAAAEQAAAAAPPPPSARPKVSLLARKPKTEAPPPPPPPARTEPLPVEIALVKVVNGRMDFADMSITPHFAAGVESLDGTIKGLSGRQDARAEVDLNGEVDRFSPVKISGQVNYFAVRSFTDVGMSFQNLEMTTFTPYSGKFAGYRINKGKLTVDLKYHIDDRKLDANHRVVINQLELGEKVDSADATKLPVKLIVALLKDRHGVIDLPIPISGTLDDPKFRVWPVIWKVVGNLFSKIATSPFALLGALGGGGEELQFIDFAPGAAGLDEASGQKLAQLGKALVERPALNLEIPMAVDPAADKAALAQARLDAQLTAAATARLGRKADAAAAQGALADPQTRRAILEELYRKQFGAKPELPKAEGDKDQAPGAQIAWLEDRLRSQAAVSDEDLRQLGKARAEAVQAALLDDGQVNAARVFITAQSVADATDGPVRMTLSLN